MALTNLSQITTSGISTLADVNLNNLTGVAATFTGNVTVGGVLTYDDVTNVDSVGLITARSGIRVLTGTATTALVVEGNARVTGILTVGTSSLTLDGTNNVVNVGTALTLGHTQGLQFHTQNLHSQGFDVNNVNATGIITATTFSGALSGTASNASNASGATGDFSVADKIVHTDDTNTAIRFPAADTISFETGGGERLRITSAGKVGIGTNNPSNFLHVKNYTVASNYITAENTTAGNAGVRLKNSQGDYAIFANAELIFYDLGNDVERLRIDSSGRVLLSGATSSNTERLYVKGSSSTTSGIFIHNANGATNSSADLWFGHWTNSSTPSAYAARISALNKNVNTGVTDLLFHVYDGNNALERLRIDSSGRILVGTDTAPTAAVTSSALFVVEGYTGVPTGDALISLQRGQAPASISSGAQLGGINFGANDGSRYAQIHVNSDGAGGTNDYPGRLVFSTTSDGSATPSERLRITSAGNVGINSTAPTKKLDVQGHAVFGPSATRLHTYSDSGYSGIYNGSSLTSDESFYMGGGNLYFRADGGEVIRVLANGKVGINESNPLQQLHVSSTASTYIQVQNTGDSVNAYYGVDTASAWAGSSTNHPFKLHTNNTERLRITSNGRLVLGHTAEVVGAYDNSSNTKQLQIINGSNSGDQGLGIYSYSSAGWAPRIELGASRSSSKGGHTVVTDGQSCGLMVFNGSDGTNFSTAAMIGANVNGTPANDSIPGSLSFYTSPGSGLIERMSIAANGAATFTGEDFPYCKATLANKKLVIEEYSSYNSNSGIEIRKKLPNGNVHPAGYWLGDVVFKGWDGDQFIRGGLIECVAEGTPANNSMPAGLRFSTNSGGTGTSERLRITSAGKLLVSGQNALTSTPQSHSLQVAAQNDANAIAIFGRNGDDIGELSYYESDKSTKLGEIQYRPDHVNIRHRVGDIRFATGGTTERVRIESDGQFLHGVTSNSAGYNLVTAGSGYRSILLGSTSGATAALIIDGAANGDGSGSDYASIEHNTDGTMRYKNRQSSGSGGAGHIFYTTNSDTERLRITSAGRVGINVTSPSEHLHIAGAVRRDTPGSSNIKFLEFSFELPSGTTTTIATVTSPIQSSMGMAIFEYMALYDYAGNAFYSGIEMASFRRKSSNSNYEYVQNSSIHASGNNSNYQPNIFWQNGSNNTSDLMITTGNYVLIVGTIRITTSNVGLTRVIAI